MATYIISDLHFGHKNLLRMERKQFETVEEHDAFIIQQFNKQVKNTDTVYILGDIGNVEQVRYLNGRKIFIIGNHDKRPIQEYKGFFAEVYDTPIYISPTIVLSHHPIKVDTHVLNIHGHLHGAQLESVNHKNVSAHIINYTPVNLNEFYQYASKLPKHDYSFLHEWYADLYVFSAPRDDIVSDQTGRIKLIETKKLREQLRKQKEGELD